MKLVVDASVAVKWFMRTSPAEAHVEQAIAVAVAIQQAETTLFAPQHWTAEVLGALVRLDPSTIAAAIVELEDMRPVVCGGSKILRRAASLAVALDHHLFDTLYHAVALDEEATLVTADARYYAKAREVGAIELLETFAI